MIVIPIFISSSSSSSSQTETELTLYNKKKNHSSVTATDNHSSLKILGVIRSDFCRSSTPVPEFHSTFSHTHSPQFQAVQKQPPMMSSEHGDYHQRLRHGATAIAATRKRERLIDPIITSSEQQNRNQNRSFLESMKNKGTPLASSLPFPFIPDELIVEILSRIPVKSLLRFRCVCKSWKSLISDPFFVRKHLHLSTQNTSFSHHRIILSTTTAEFHLKSCRVSSLFKNPSTICEDLWYPVKNKYRHDGIIGSCNGLLCFAIKGECVLLWNPSIRISKKSPPLGNDWRPGCFTAFGLGYDHVNNDYKVVAVFCDPDTADYFDRTRVKVYSLATNSWRKIQDFPYGVTPYHDFGKFVNGTLNWAANISVGSTTLWVIVSLDLAKETYGEILPPDYEKEDSSTPTLGVLKSCLCMNYDHRKTDFVVWLMKEYGVKESWMKLVTIPYLPNPEDFSYSMPFCVTEDGKVLLMFEFDLVLYDPRDQSFKYPKIESGKGWFDAEVYVETLVSPIMD